MRSVSEMRERPVIRVAPAGSVKESCCQPVKFRYAASVLPASVSSVSMAPPASPKTQKFTLS